MGNLFVKKINEGGIKMRKIRQIRGDQKIKDNKKKVSGIVSQCVYSYALVHNLFINMLPKKLQTNS